MKFKTPRGTRDLGPKDMIKRQYIVGTCQGIFEKFGFDPLETPAFETWDLLSAKGGEEIKKEIYYFKDKSKRELGLRFDLTVPLARFITNNPDLPKPFRRYQIGRVWRYDRPGADRYREFWQADADIIGTENEDAEVECVAAACSVLDKLGVTFTIRMNNRVVVEEFVKSLKIKDIDQVFRSIDKLAKIGEDGVRAELEKAKITKGNIDKIIEFTKSKKKSDIVSKLTKKGKDAFESLEKIKSSLDKYRFISKIDMSLVRGLAYYTGPVFEIDGGSGVSIGGGGRYDNLVKSLGGPKLPATGISLGIDRIANIMEDIAETRTILFVVSVGDSKEKVMRIINELREIGIACEFDLTGRSISKQMSYANSRGIPFVLVIGDRELKVGKANMRNMKTGKEISVSLKDIREIADLI